MRTLYFDCFAGASGNMILGGLISLGVDPDKLRSELRALAVDGFEIKIDTVDRSGIQATHVNVAASPERKHRHLKDITAILESSELSEMVRQRAIKIFTRLAEAEAKVHGCRIDQVHFHEVGAVDAIVDVVGACIGFEMLGVERFVGSRLNVGSGFIQIDHGTYPVPPPAVANLLTGVPAYSNGVEGELLTPTGAAVISSLCESYGGFPDMTVEAVGYGAGTRTYEKFPNVLRLVIGEGSGADLRPDSFDSGNGLLAEKLLLLETNVDDSSPQITAFAVERIMAAGALDCWVTPVQMKKGRPASLISAVCRPEQQTELLEIIFRETTSLGVRSREIDRLSLERDFAEVGTQFGEIRVKIARLRGEIVNVMPEFDEVKAAAEQFGVPAGTVHSAVMTAYYSGTAAFAAA